MNKETLEQDLLQRENSDEDDEVEDEDEDDELDFDIDEIVSSKMNQKQDKLKPSTTEKKATSTPSTSTSPKSNSAIVKDALSKQQDEITRMLKSADTKKPQTSKPNNNVKNNNKNNKDDEEESDDDDDGDDDSVEDIEDILGDLKGPDEDDLKIIVSYNTISRLLLNVFIIKYLLVYCDTISSY